MNGQIPKSGQEIPEAGLSSGEGAVRAEDVGQAVESFEAHQKRERKYLNDSIETLFGAKMGGGYAHSNEKAFSGDAASIYLVVSMKDKEGNESPELVNVGWGEFSRETFESGRYPTFKNFPYDIYCVSQTDSFFADEKLRKEMAENPQKFLAEHSLFVASNGKVQTSERIDHRTRSLNRAIQAVPYADVLRTVRNQIISEQTEPGEFAAFLRELPDSADDLGAYVADLENRVDWMSHGDLEKADEKTKADVRKKHLMHMLWGMGTETIGIAIGDRKPMESIMALKQQFDFATGSFK